MKNLRKVRKRRIDLDQNRKIILTRLNLAKTKRNKKRKESAQNPPRVYGQSGVQLVVKEDLALVDVDQGPRVEDHIPGRVVGPDQETVVLAPDQGEGDLKRDEKGLDQSLDRNLKADERVRRNVHVLRNERSPRSRRNPVNVLLRETSCFYLFT